jgi:hypothetical protein
MRASALDGLLHVLIKLFELAVSESRRWLLFFNCRLIGDVASG